MANGKLSPEQKVRAAYLVLCEGIGQTQVASAYGVNSGRVNEAVKAVEKATGFSRGGYKQRKFHEVKYIGRKG